MNISKNESITHWLALSKVRIWRISQILWPNSLWNTWHALLMPLKLWPLIPTTNSMIGMMLLRDEGIVHIFFGRKINLHFCFESLRNSATGIEDDPTGPRLSYAKIWRCKTLIPVFTEICITLRIAPKTWSLNGGSLKNTLTDIPLLLIVLYKDEP